MPDILLDLNVLLDFLNQRKFHADAAQIMEKGAHGQMRIFVSAHEITTLAYFLDKQKHSARDGRQALSLLFTLLQVLPVDKEVLEEAVRSRIDDFEDAVLEAVSLKHGLRYIVTRNVKDFSHSRVEAVNPSVFLGLL
jgi:predicted nucleic acid-binding protein